MFELQSQQIAIGDPVMGMVRYELTGFTPGLYSLATGCLAKPKHGSQGKEMGLDSVCLYVVGASREDAFTKLFHQFGRGVLTTCLKCRSVIPIWKNNWACAWDSITPARKKITTDYTDNTDRRQDEQRQRIRRETESAASSVNSAICHYSIRVIRVIRG
jgi:hypothetical protein